VRRGLGDLGHRPEPDGRGERRGIGEAQARVAERVDELEESTGRTLWVIAESDLNDPKVRERLAREGIEVVPLARAVGDRKGTP